MKLCTSIAAVTLLVCSRAAFAAEPPAAPPSTTVDGAAGAHGEEAYLPGPGGGELETHGPPPLESTGLEDGPGSCNCASALGSSSSSHPGWLALGLGFLTASRRSRRRRVGALGKGP